MNGMSRYQVSGWLDNGLLKQIDYAAETGKIKAKQSIQLIASGFVALVASGFFVDVPSTSTSKNVSSVSPSNPNSYALFAADQINHRILGSIQNFDSPTITDGELALLSKARIALTAVRDRKLTHA